MSLLLTKKTSKKLKPEVKRYSIDELAQILGYRYTELKFVNAVINAIKSGYISYVAHPDVFNFTGNVDVYKRESARLLKACKEYNVPVEINCLGIRTNRHYPRKEFWELAGEIGTPVVVGIDAHDEFATYDETTLRVVNLLIRTYNLNFIKDFKPKLLK